MAADEAGGAGQRDQRPRHRDDLAALRREKRRSSRPTRTAPARKRRDLHAPAWPGERHSGASAASARLSANTCALTAHHRKAVDGGLLVEMAAMRLPDLLAPREAAQQRDGGVQRDSRAAAGARRRARPVPASCSSSQPTRRPMGRRADIAEEEPRDRLVEGRKAEERAAAAPPRRAPACGGSAPSAPSAAMTARDRHHLGDRDPVEPVHEVDEVHEPDAAEEQEGALERQRNRSREGCAIPPP